MASEEEYYLVLNGVLVRVSPGAGKVAPSWFSPGNPPKVKDFVKDPETPVNEDVLLEALKEYHGNVGPVDPHGSTTLYVPLPSANFLNEVKSGNQQVLVDYIKTNSLQAVCDSKFDLIHLCALGGFPKSFEFLQNIKLREIYTHFNTGDYGEYNASKLAAIGGHTNVLDHVKEADLNEGSVISLCGNPKFRHALLWKLKKMHIAKPEMYQPQYFADSPLETIPSLTSICLAVIGAQLTRKRLSPSSLSLIPDPLFAELCENLARENGYTTLAWLKKENPGQGRKIPTSVWLDSMHASEQKTRNFTYSGNVLLEDYEQPLIDVFDEYDTFVIESPDECEEKMTKFLPQPREVGAPSVVNQQQFLEQFKIFTGGLFDDFDFTNTVVTGGSVVGSLLPRPSSSSLSLDEYYKTESPFKGSDIDIYIYGVDAAGFKLQITKIYERVKKWTDGKAQILQSENQVVFMAHYPFRHIQINLVKFRTVWQILTGVDIDCSAFAFDGKKLWALPRARMALNRRWTITNTDLYKIRASPQYESRLLKYARRGFTICDRNLHEYKLNASYETSAPYVSVYSGYWDTSGASLLLNYFKWPEMEQHFSEFAETSGLPYGEKVGDKEVDYNLENAQYMVDCGYGPEDTYLEKIKESEFLAQDFTLCDEATMTDKGWYVDLQRKENDENGESGKM